MTTDLMPVGLRESVRSALARIGYSIFEPEYTFRLSEADGPEGAPLPLVAFWQDTKDQFASAIAVRWIATRDGQVNRHLKTLANDLWVPYSILARPSGCDIWETIGDQSVSEQNAEEQDFRPLDQAIAYEALPTVLLQRTGELGPDNIARRKRVWRQKALYEASPEPDAFLQWAYRPTRDRLVDVFSTLLKGMGGLAESSGALPEYLRWLIRLLGVRIVWDKRWMDPGDRTSRHDLVSAAQRYPTEIRQPDRMDVEIGLAVAELVVQQLAGVHLAAADGGLLSQVVQGNGVPKDLVRRWRLFPTPPDIAWRLLAGLPIEGIEPEERFLWDGTCGTGTILVAALERLRSLSSLHGPDLRTYLVDHVRGNDQQPAMTDATRIALDLALGAAAGPNWTITTGDISQTTRSLHTQRPSIIASNPPFRRSGHAPDEAITVIREYLDALAADGLLAVLAPRSFLGTLAGADLRRQMVEQCEFFEVTELPPGVFPRTEVQATALLARKRSIKPESSNSVGWRVLDKSRSRQFIETVDQRAWRKPPRYAFQSPLALRLDAALSHTTELAEFVPKLMRTEGLRLGAARDAVLDHYRPGTVPYLGGWTGMLPFYIPWEKHPQWILYPSPDIKWDRAQYVDLFHMKKVIVTTRASQHGNAWRVRAAVDSNGLFPNSGFEVLAPLPPLTPEFVAAVLNSSLLNCWLRLNNPANTLSLDTLLRIPVPRVNEATRTALDHIAQELASLWRTVALKGRTAELLDNALRLTHALDQEVYALYGVPVTLQREIAELFISLGDARPGFGEPAVTLPAPDLEEAIFTPASARRLRRLFELRDERDLTPAESQELDELVSRWEQANAQIDSPRIKLNASLTAR